MKNCLFILLASLSFYAAADNQVQTINQKVYEITNTATASYKDSNGQLKTIKSNESRITITNKGRSSAPSNEKNSKKG